MSEHNTDQRAGSLFDRQLARIAVGAYDDAQDVRTSLMNRIRDVVRKRNEGIPFDEVEEEKEDEDFDAKYEDDNLPEIVEEMREEDKLSEREFEYLQEMLGAAAAAEAVEERYKKVMEITEMEPVYQQWLTHVYGVSTTLTARLIHKFGYCSEFEKVSNMWSYSGLAPGQERVRGEKLGYDPEAKTLAWLVADNMIKQGSRSEYRVAFYEPYKQKQLDRLEAVADLDDDEWETRYDPENDVTATFAVSGTDPETGEPQLNERLFSGSPPESQGHADARARRYLAKKFLKHYWAITRDLQDLPVPDEYIITHGGHDKREDTWENPFYAKRQLRTEA